MEITTNEQDCKASFLYLPGPIKNFHWPIQNGILLGTYFRHNMPNKCAAKNDGKDIQHS